MNKNQILITGCAGFIGSHLCENLLNDKNYSNYNIIGIDNLDPYYSVDCKKNNLKILEKFSNFKFYNEDIRNTKIIEKYKPKIVIHLAGMAGVRYSLNNPIIYTDVNINGLINLLEQARKYNIQKFMFASSSSVYGNNLTIPFSENDKINNQTSPYAISKKMMEEFSNFYSKMYNINIIGFRFFTVYGPRGRPDMAPFKFISRIKNNIEIEKYGKGESLRDYTYIDDIINGIKGGIVNDIKGFEIYNLGNSNPITLNKFITICEKVCGKKALIKQMGDQKGDVNITYANITKSRNNLGYNPKVKLEEGLKKLYDSL